MEKIHDLHSFEKTLRTRYLSERKRHGNFPSQEDYNAVQSEKFVEDTFDGSLPAFLAAFTTRKSLSEKDIAEIQRMIDRCGKE